MSNTIKFSLTLLPILFVLACSGSKGGGGGDGAKPVDGKPDGQSQQALPISKNAWCEKLENEKGKFQARTLFIADGKYESDIFLFTDGGGRGLKMKHRDGTWQGTSERLTITAGAKQFEFSYRISQATQLAVKNAEGVEATLSACP